MKKMLVVLLLLLTCLCGCIHRTEPAPMIQPVTFYYRTAQTDYSAEDGVIRAEIRDLGEGSFTDTEIFARYFEGPVSKDLVSPISQEMKLVSVSRSNNRLDIRLSQDNSPTELDHTLSFACLAKTGLALEGVSKVRIIADNMEYSSRFSEYTANSFLLYDNGEGLNTIDVTLYYADENGSFLLPEKRTVPMMSEQELAAFVLELLSSAPESGGMQPTLRPGTALTDSVTVSNGVCTVDLYPDNTPEQEQAQMLSILSVVNTLCKLESINQVQIYVVPVNLQPDQAFGYRFLDLSNPWTPDNAVIGPVREELGEFAGVLCLPGQRDALLHRLTVRGRAKVGLSKEEALLQMLFSRIQQNGLSVPFGESPSILSVSTKGTVCTAELGAGTLPQEEPGRTLAVRSITATLTSLPEIESVILTEEGDPVQDDPILPQTEWFVQPPTDE